MTTPAEAASRPRRGVALVAVTLVLTAAFLIRFATAGSGDEPAAAAQDPLAVAAAAVEANPRDARALRELGLAHLARFRSDADPSALARAQDALDRSDRIEPGVMETLVARGLLAATRHDFSAALALGEEAASRNPASAAPLGVVVDALVELGRYDEAVEVAQRMVDLKPNLASLTRASYVVELRGDRSRAIALMEQALVTQGGSPVDRAYVLALLGELQLASGDAEAATETHVQALDLHPRSGEATLGLARARAARGDLAGARSLLEPLVRRLPLPDAAALLAEVAAAQGDERVAVANVELVRAIEQLAAAQGGVAVDLELARFEAEHAPGPGEAAERAVALATAARETRPTVYADDALAWALHKSGDHARALELARSATRLGTPDASFWFHRAAIEHALGRVEEARASLRKAFDVSPWFGVRTTSAARELAQQLDVPVPR